MFKSGEKMRISKRLLAWGLVLVLMTAIAVGDVGQEAVEQGGGGAVIAASGTDVGRAAEMTGDRIRSITFQKDTTIRDALRFLAAKYKKNIVPSPNVDGILAFTSLYDVTFEEAMDAIMGMNLRYEQKGQLIRVYTKDEYKKVMTDKERMISKVYTLYYISAAEAVKLVTPVLSQAGSITGSSPAETVVPTGTSISAGAGGGDTMALNDKIVIVDYPENVAKAEALIKKLDVRPLQVLVEATILSANLNEGMRFGVDLNLLAGVHLKGSTSITSYSSGDSLQLTESETSPIGQLGQGIATGTPIETAGFATVGNGLRIGITTGDVVAFITALEQVTDTTILANPKILAVNKQLGQVYIGNKIGYVSQTTQTQTSTTQQVEFLETGTKLSFRPYIGDDGYIRMDIQPKDSSGTLKTNNIPDESSTELATNIIVKDGETVVIGGLFRDSVVTSRSQVPLLGDLPFVGGLFRSTNDTTVRQEVIVLLTPHIVKEPSETKAAERMEDVRRMRFGAKEGLQPIERSKLADDYYVNAVKNYADGCYDSALEELNKALKIRPSYLEAIRLKERILHETSADAARQIERKIVSEVERPDTENWIRP